MNSPVLVNRGAKQWLAARMPAGYDPLSHQPLFTEHFSFDLAGGVPSFARLQRKARTLFADHHTSA